jgi:hypothetical protein
VIQWSDEQLAEVGIDKKRLVSLVRLLRRASKEMWELDLYIYGASGSGNLIHRSRPPHSDNGRGNRMKPDFGSVIANVGEGFDGGDW